MIVLAVAAVICLIAALGLLYFALNTPSPSLSGLTGSPAPDFSLPSLNGQDINLEELRGKPVLINFWAIWCDPCLVEMPLLEETSQKYSANGLVIIGINQGDSFADVKDFAQEEDLSFPILVDQNESLGRLYSLSGYPTSVFVDRDGIIRALYLGEIPRAQLEANLRLIGIQ